jgi:hypothetical protein
MYGVYIVLLLILLCLVCIFYKRQKTQQSIIKKGKQEQEDSNQVLRGLTKSLMGNKPYVPPNTNFSRKTDGVFDKDDLRLLTMVLCDKLIDVVYPALVLFFNKQLTQQQNDTKRISKNPDKKFDNVKTILETDDE